MSAIRFSHEEIVREAKFSPEDMIEIKRRRRDHTRLGLLKGEEVNGLARQVAYGKHGTITARDLQAQTNTASCLTLIMSCIIYWQSKEINRVILECDPDGAEVDLSLLEYISPVGWENIILYSEYVLNRDLIE